VNLEVSSITKEVSNPSSGSLAYQIGTRTASTVLRLKDGETQVLAGLINNTDTKSGSGIAGLSEMPILGRLFSNKSDKAGKTEVVLSITPHIVASAKLQEAGSIEYWTGTDSTLRENPLVLRQTGTVSLPTPGGAAATPGAAVPGAARPGPAPGARGPSRTVPRTPGDVPATAATPAVDPATAALPAVVGVQAPAQAKVGDKFTVQLTAQFPQATSGIGFQLSYDPSALKVLDVTEGDLFRQRGLESNFVRDVDASGGQVSVEISQKSGDPSPGAGSVAAISFEVIAAKPQSTLTVTRVTPTGADGSALPFSMPAPHAMTLNP
jgi:general secretion pathway protein D